MTHLDTLGPCVDVDTSTFAASTLLGFKVIMKWH